MERFGMNEILAIVKEHQCFEDFDYRYSQQKNDFKNSYYHKKTKHPMVSLEAFQEDYKKNHDGAEWDKADIRIDLEGDIAAKVDVERFMATLSEKDRQILELRVEGFTYQEIADKVGYKTHSAVKKRIDKIGSKFQEHTNTDIGFE
jgi:DNA-directed RNA polymerase specialized sigma24 family protein